MTDRHAGYIVTLDRSIREDDAELVINALRMIHGVVSVQPVIDDVVLQMASERANSEWRDRLIAIVKESMGAQ